MSSMPHANAPEVVLGVDTHKDFHVAAVVTDQAEFIATETFPTTALGYRQLLAWATAHGNVRRAGVECTGSYGAALTRYLLTQGIIVIEVNQGDRAERRRRARVTLSMLKRQHALCCPAARTRSRRPATARSRSSGCYEQRRHPP